MINELFAAIQNIFNMFIPVRMVQENEHGIRWSFGRIGKIVRGKMLWKIPLADIVNSIEVLDATWAGYISPVQCVSTLDFRAVAIRVGLEWRISDADKFVLEAGKNDFDDILAVIVQSSTAFIVAKDTLANIIARQKPTETSVRNKVSELIGGYGVEIKRAHIIECVPVFPLRVYQDVANQYVTNPTG